MHRVCFAPVDHPDGSHDNFPSSPFGPDSDIWIGYRDEPKKSYSGFISFQKLIEKAQANFKNGYKDRFPRYLLGFESYRGGPAPPDEELSYNAQCTACSEKENCDRILMQYFPIRVWDYKRAKSTHIFLCGYVFTVQDKIMIALIKHKSQGYYGFQRTNGEVSKAMTINCVSVHDSSAKPSSRNSEVSGTNTSVEAQSPTTLAIVETMMDHEHVPRSAGRSIVIDLTIDEDEAPIKQETTVLGSQLENQTNTVPSSITTGLTKEFGAMMASIAVDFGVESLSLPEAKNIKSQMAQAARSGDREMLCQTFGSLNALLLSRQ